MANLIKSFAADTQDFAAKRAAEGFLRAAGFSYGSAQRGAPIGLMFGDCAIAKWRNLDDEDRATLHGTMTGDMRYGPILVTIRANAPQAAKRAFHRQALFASLTAEGKKP